MFKNLFKSKTEAKPPPLTVSPEEQQKLREAPLEQQLHNDVVQWGAFIYDKEMASIDSSYPERQDVMKRIFMLVQSSVLTRTKDSENEKLPSMNIASLLSHGGRLIIQVPPLSEENPDSDTLIDALFPGKSRALFQNRTFATHALEIVNNAVVEIDLKPEGKINYPKVYEYQQKKRNYGMDIGVSYKGAAAAKGQNGHVYLHWMPPTPNAPGGLMIGVETCAPGEKNPYGVSHDSDAVKGEFSPTGGTKFTSDQFRAYQKAGLVLSPDGGLRIELSCEQMQTIKKTIGQTEQLNLQCPIRVMDRLVHQSVVTIPEEASMRINEDRIDESTNKIIKITLEASGVDLKEVRVSDTSLPMTDSLVQEEQNNINTSSLSDENLNKIEENTEPSSVPEERTLVNDLSAKNK
jgi:hypothetical protein